MKRETLIKRIEAKLDWTLSTEAPDRCLIWPMSPAAQIQRPILKMARDLQGRPYMVPVVIKTPTTITVDGKRLQVARVIYELIYPDLADTPYRGSQLCQTPHCVNPGHWGFAPRRTTQGPDDEPQSTPYPDEPPEDTGWTIEEATEFVDKYLILEPTMPFIRDHNLLIDIPDDLLREALALANKEHFLP